MGVPNEVIAVLGYDPFGPVEPAPPQADQPPVQPQAPLPPEQAVAPVAPAVPTNELEAVKQQLANVTGELQRMRGPAQPAQAPGQPQDPVPPYTYEIPDQILHLLASENPGDRKLGLGNVMTAVSRSVHGLMQRELAQVIPALARAVMMEHLAQQETGRDFYGKYPMLDKPELRPLIHQLATGWVQANPHAQWNAQTRDAIAELAFKTFNMQRPGGATPPPPAAPVMMPTMTRPAGNHVASEQDEMLDLMR